jgi:spiro-SPASM protein
MAIEKVRGMSIISSDMKNLAVANALAVGPYALEALAGGGSALQRIGEYARGLPGVKRRVLLTGADQQLAAPEGFTVAPLRDSSLTGLLEKLQELADGFDNLFYFFADCPLLDGALSARMLESHTRYFADYTFADGYPAGLSPEILRASLPGALRTLAERSGDSGAEEPLDARSREAIFEVIKKDINAFDIETELAPTDLRLLRAQLFVNNRRNRNLVEAVLTADGRDAESACAVLQERGELLRTLPAFFNLQIVEGCPQLCSYCPYPRFGIREAGKLGEMPLEAFESILAEVQRFCEDAVISVSLWGEPAYHSRFAELALAVLRRGFRLVVETSGVGWQEGVFEALAREAPGGPAAAVDWVVSLDASTETTYASLRGEGFAAATQTVETLHRLFPGKAYVQAVRMQDNEEEMEAFYRHWKKATGRPIVQKYDHFCGFLPDRRVTDLSPLKRFPCWHLRRDLAVLLDGTVLICREDLKRRHPLGNLFHDGLETVWAAGAAFYRKHLQEDYPELCRGCDEYYSFNF